MCAPCFLQKLKPPVFENYCQRPASFVGAIRVWTSSHSLPVVRGTSAPLLWLRGSPPLLLKYSKMWPAMRVDQKPHASTQNSGISDVLVSLGAMHVAAGVLHMVVPVCTEHTGTSALDRPGRATGFHPRLPGRLTSLLCCFVCNRFEFQSYLPTFRVLSLACRD